MKREGSREMQGLLMQQSNKQAALLGWCITHFAVSLSAEGEEFAVAEDAFKNSFSSVF